MKFSKERRNSDVSGCKFKRKSRVSIILITSKAEQIS